jgi:hypothetical protein
MLASSLPNGHYGYNVHFIHALNLAAATTIR